MQYRHDVLFSSAETATELESMVANSFLQGPATVGERQVRNGSRNIIAADLIFTVDLRHPDDALLA